MEDVSSSHQNENIDDQEQEIERNAPFKRLADALAGIRADADLDFIRKAYTIARNLHRGQKRDEGTPYFLHPYRVALFIIEELGVDSEKLIATALLHDVLEDSDTFTFSDLKREMGPDVAACVNIMTKPPVTARRTKAMRDIQYHEKLQNAPAAVAKVKLADRLDNVRSLSLCPDRMKIRKYIKETREIYIPLALRHSQFLMQKIEDALRVVEAGL